jgi:hypothetical protein
MPKHVLSLDIDALAADYFADYEIDAEGDATPEANAERGWRALSVISGVLNWNPDQAWDLILAMLEIAPRTEDIMDVGAGPLEDLIREYGPDFVDRIAAEAERNVKAREALAGVWGWEKFSSAVRARLVTFLPDDRREQVASARRVALKSASRDTHQH